MPLNKETKPISIGPEVLDLFIVSNGPWVVLRWATVIGLSVK